MELQILKKDCLSFNSVTSMFHISNYGMLMCLIHVTIYHLNSNLRINEMVKCELMEIFQLQFPNSPAHRAQAYHFQQLLPCQSQTIDKATTPTGVLNGHMG